MTDRRNRRARHKRHKERTRSRKQWGGAFAAATDRMDRYRSMMADFDAFFLARLNVLLR